MSGGFVSYSVELFNFLNMETAFTVFDIDGLTDGIMQTVQLMPGVTYDLSISMWMELINMGTVENGGDFMGMPFENVANLSLTGIVTENPVPLPGAFCLLGSGLIGLAGIVRRKQ